ncbi:MAG: Crp/Fnr family transcriptional regulator [Microscillaceae bacterium]|nr:Crp/Fnr family transcriptional regulator [Microscillaceae bacterium]
MNGDFKNYLSSYLNLSLIQSEKIVSFFKPTSLKKNDFFLKSGSLSNRLAFVQSGILREYLLTSEGKEITKWISTRGFFVVDLESFLFEKAARYHVQALEDSALLVIHKSHYNHIQDHIPEWPSLEKLFIVKCFSILEERIITHLSLTAEERYHWLFAYQPELFNAVPLQYLASMLGMTPETLSRIRKKNAERNS